MNSDLQCKKLTAAGTVFNGPGRVVSVFSHTQASGSFQLRDGGASGTILLDIDLPNSETNSFFLGGNGLRFTSSIYLAGTNLVSVTVCWG